jgi:hypothetical protein
VWLTREFQLSRSWISFLPMIVDLSVGVALFDWQFVLHSPMGIRVSASGEGKSICDRRKTHIWINVYV